MSSPAPSVPTFLVLGVALTQVDGLATWRGDVGQLRIAAECDGVTWCVSIREGISELACGWGSTADAAAEDCERRLREKARTYERALSTLVTAQNRASLERDLATMERQVAEGTLTESERPYAAEMIDYARTALASVTS